MLAIGGDLSTIILDKLFFDPLSIGTRGVGSLNRYRYGELSARQNAFEV